MKYTVVWQPEAEQSLAQIWLGSRFRESITRAAFAMDEELATDAHQCGESREDDIRVLIFSPLGVYFQASPNDRIARVLSVWKFEKR